MTGKFSMIRTNVRMNAPIVAGRASGNVILLMTREMLPPWTSAASSSSGFMSARALATNRYAYGA
ncbi:hypothetical protein BH23ACT8_BH23ACT8_10620 [soil metagenome]